MEYKLEGTRVEVARMVMVRDGEARHTPSLIHLYRADTLGGLVTTKT